ncbi:hypothetical protein TrST_g2267 [Triparma strigata]|uniref:Myb-like domain-containing protein n=1 Tax=Triparma strigata TaxID=1606541 RepID=A0A9W7EDW9_9STRA|nr:hypothetical protein TrST_g2267 [Triparma strigata]
MMKIVSSISHHNVRDMNAVKQEEESIDVKVEYLMVIKREEGYFDELSEDGDVDGGDDVGGGEVVVKEEEVKEVVEEKVVGVKRKVEEETEPRKKKRQWNGKGFTWTEEEEAALLKGVGKYGLDYERIRGDNDKVLADRNPTALYIRLYNRLYTKFPEKYKELRAVTPRKSKNQHVAWTAEQDAALKRGMKEHGRDWDKICTSEQDILGDRTLRAMEQWVHDIRKRYEK